jgi:PST family polysaccharide transporter
MANHNEKRAGFGGAVKWALLMNWGQEGLTGLVTLLLAYLLGPSAFGLVAMALAYILFIELFVGQGFNPALVQRKDLRDEHLDAVFITVMGLSGVLVLLSLALSTWWAAIYDTPELRPVILVLSVSIPIRGFTIVQEALQTRAMHFKNLALARTSSVVAGGVVGVVFAFAGFGVWALVAQHLVRSSWMSAVLWYRSWWRPRMRFSWPHARPLYDFSLRSFPATLLDFAGRYAEIFVLAALFGPVVVGLFRLATRLVDMANEVVTKALWMVAFPYFSEAQDNPELLQERLRNCVRMAGAFAVPLLAMLASASPWLLELLGDDWLPALPALQILCAYGVLKAFAIFAGPVLQAVYKPHILSVLMGIYCLAICIACTLAGLLFRNQAVEMQLAAVAGARVLVTGLVYLPLALRHYQRETGLSHRDFGSVVWPSMAAGLAALAAVSAVGATGLLEQLPLLVALGLAAALSVIVAVVTLMLFDKTMWHWTLHATSSLFARASSRPCRVTEERREIAILEKRIL